MQCGICVGPCECERPPPAQVACNLNEKDSWALVLRVLERHEESDRGCESCSAHWGQPHTPGCEWVQAYEAAAGWQKAHEAVWRMNAEWAAKRALEKSNAP